MAMPLLYLHLCMSGVAITWKDSDTSRHPQHTNSFSRCISDRAVFLDGDGQTGGEAHEQVEQRAREARRDRHRRVTLRDCYVRDDVPDAVPPPARYREGPELP